MSPVGFVHERVTELVVAVAERAVGALGAVESSVMVGIVVGVDSFPTPSLAVAVKVLAVLRFKETEMEKSVAPPVSCWVPTDEPAR